MRLLLDSHTVYWWMIGSPRLSTPARQLIVDKEHAVRVSAASIYELEFKARRRRIELPPQELRAALRRNAVEDLAITLDHAEYAAHLNWV
jgi:PIN domain nuclease of toxin-antitoxin system